MQYGILFISPSREDATTLSGMLGEATIPLEHADDLRRARQKLDRETYGVILTESRLPDGTWEDVVNLTAERKLRCSVVVTDALADARLWADVLDLGAYDLLPKPFCCSEVQRILTNALNSPAELRKVAHSAL